MKKIINIGSYLLLLPSYDHDHGHLHEYHVQVDQQHGLHEDLVKVLLVAPGNCLILEAPRNEHIVEEGQKI